MAVYHWLSFICAVDSDDIFAGRYRLGRFQISHAIILAALSHFFRQKTLPIKSSHLDMLLASLHAFLLHYSQFSISQSKMPSRYIPAKKKRSFPFRSFRFHFIFITSTPLHDISAISFAMFFTQVACAFFHFSLASAIFIFRQARYYKESTPLHCHWFASRFLDSREPSFCFHNTAYCLRHEWFRFIAYRVSGDIDDY